MCVILKYTFSRMNHLIIVFDYTISQNAVTNLLETFV